MNRERPHFFTSQCLCILLCVRLSCCLFSKVPSHKRRKLFSCDFREYATIRPWIMKTLKKITLMWLWLLLIYCATLCVTGGKNGFIKILIVNSIIIGRNAMMHDNTGLHRKRMKLSKKIFISISIYIRLLFNDFCHLSVSRRSLNHG